MKVEYNSYSVRVWITISFVILAIVLELTMARYWSAILEPKLRSQAQTNAQLLAQSQAIAIADVLSQPELTDTEAKQEVQSVFDHLLLIKDPDLDEHFFISIALEVDYDAVNVMEGSLELSQGELNCNSCFEAPVELYSRRTEELLGIATFYVSDVFFRKLKNELKDRFIIEGVIAFTLLLLLWLIVINLVRSLYKQIEQRKKTHEALLIAKEQAESANAARGQFLANMSHEIRTPMNAIIGLCYVVLKSDLTTFQRNYLSKVHSSARSLLTLINDILDFSKIEAGKFDIEKIEFDMDDVLENLSQMILPESDEKDLDILFSVTQEVPFQLKGDPFRLGQVLLNLVNNAVKFTEQGEIVVSVDVDEVISTSKIRLVFSVKDTGVGIAPEATEQLFSSFTQADSSMSRKYGGTGLGLAICKSLVEMMHGRIWVQSELDVGSTFFFTAQFDLDSPETFDRFIIPEEIRNIHVLVVDDNATSRQVYSQMMSSLHFNVTVASSALQAIDLISHQPNDTPFELILMDWQMPDIDGIEAAKMIKQNSTLMEKTSIILISGHAKEDAFYEAREFIDAYLLKPVCQSTLYDCIVGIFCQVPRQSYSNFANESIRSKVVSNFRGKRILLVEDNKTNQEVALNLLDDVQLKTQCANNGKEAVEKLQTDKFDLVLMDVQMPQMDGITATQIIREQINSEIPIIAMTAHAMQGDKDKCLSAGMNDYLTKPIEVEHFYQTIEKWLPEIGECGFSDDIASKELLNEDAELHNEIQGMPELPGIDYTSALARLIGNESLLKKLIANFEQHNRKMLNQLHTALNEQNWTLAQQIVHGIKGEAGNIAAIELFETANELEKLLGTDAQKAVEMMATFELQMTLVFQSSKAVRELCVKSSGKEIEDTHKNNFVDVHQSYTSNGSVVEIDVKEIQEQLIQIAQLLAKNNLKAKKQIAELDKLFKGVEFEVELSQLNQCIDVLDFKGALHQIEVISNKLSNSQSV